MRARDFIDEVNMDSREGAGAVPYNADVDYFGIRVTMKPTTWLSLAHELQKDSTTSTYIEKLAKYMKDGGAIAPPWYNIRIPREWEDGDLTKPANIVGHEGRHRMEAVIATEGDTPVEVHFFFPGGLRARDIKPEWIDRMNKNIINERGQIITGPWFTHNNAN
jgi:hypothetical protein